MRSRTCQIRVASLCIAVLLAACSPSSLESSEPCIVGASISNPYQIELSHPLRYTTVWTTGGTPQPAYHVLGGGPVNAETGEFHVDLRMPSAELSRRLAPKSELYLSSASAEVTAYRVVEAYRPRVVVYEDVNDNERLDLGQSGATDPDQVLAIDDDYSTMGAILDVEDLLRESAPSLVDLYYKATRGRFTAFVPMMGTGDYLYLGEASFAYRFSLEDAGFALASLQCLRSVSTSTITVAQNVVLDDSLDAAYCGLEYGDCRLDNLEALPAPAVSAVRSSSYQRRAVCRQRGDLEALAVSETRLQCERCSCDSTQTLKVFVTAADALPSWWPCGDEVDYCKSRSSLTAYPIECFGLAGGTAGAISGAQARAAGPVLGR